MARKHLFASLAAVVFLGVAAATSLLREANPALPDQGLFAEVARVLRHPRCLNCHPSGDRPHVTDDRLVHAMDVQRGPDDKGMPGMRCSTCHHEAHQDLARVPGAPNWHLAPRSMGWEGLDDHDLAKTLIDRSKNGDRSLADVRSHLSTDPLVLSCWSPVPGLTPPPVGHSEFVEAFDAWMDAGTPIPVPGTTTF